MNKNLNNEKYREEQILRGKRIRDIRENELRLTKTDWAKKIGISSQFLGLVEEGKGNLSYKCLRVLRELSGHSADYILFGLDDNVIRQTKIFLEKYSETELIGAFDMLQEIAYVLRLK